MYVLHTLQGPPAYPIAYQHIHTQQIQSQTNTHSKNEGIVDQWLFIRYMVIGTYVGVVTVMGFVWWYLWYEVRVILCMGAWVLLRAHTLPETHACPLPHTTHIPPHPHLAHPQHSSPQDGPKLTWSQLVNFVHCKEGEQPYSCSIFSDKQPSTISMSVLVVVEMFNALNALSENESLLRVTCRGGGGCSGGGRTPSHASHLTSPLYPQTHSGAILEQPMAAQCYCAVHAAAFHHPLHSMACVVVFCDIPVMASLARDTVAVVPGHHSG